MSVPKVIAFILCMLCLPQVVSAADLRLFSLGDLLSYGPEEQPTIAQAVTGPDGSLWLTRTHRNAILHITLDGHVERYASGNFQPFALTVSKNRIYFNQYTTDMLGMMDRNVTQLGILDERRHYMSKQLPKQVKSVVNLSASPDGRVWFTDYVGNHIGRMEPNGRVAIYNLPALISHPVTIQVTSPGHVAYVAETQSHRTVIVEMSVAGAAHIIRRWPDSAAVGVFHAGAALCFHSTERQNRRVGCRRGSPTDFWEKAIPPTSLITGLDGGEILAYTGQLPLTRKRFAVVVLGGKRSSTINVQMPESVQFNTLAGSSTRAAWFLSNRSVGVALRLQ